MKLVFRFTLFVVSVLCLLALAGLGTYTITHDVWKALGMIGATALILANIVDDVLGIGEFFGHRRAMREREEDDPMKKAIIAALGKHGLTPMSMHRVGSDEDDDDAMEEAVVKRLAEVANAITDPDMKEFAFHFVHVAQDCPGSLAHAERLHEVVAHIEARLLASTIKPIEKEDRPTLH